jgi:hypothetical protein
LRNLAVIELWVQRTVNVIENPLPAAVLVNGIPSSQHVKASSGRFRRSQMLRGRPTSLKVMFLSSQVVAAVASCRVRSAA